MNAAQANAFTANSGFAAAAVQNAMVACVLAVALVWGVWAVRSAYVAWADQAISQRQLLIVAIRVAAIYAVLTFFLLS